MLNRIENLIRGPETGLKHEWLGGQEVMKLFRSNVEMSKKVRLIGVKLSELSFETSKQLTMRDFFERGKNEKNKSCVLA